MDFQESELQAQLRDLARKFSQKTIRPQIDEDERNEHFRPEWVAELGRLGLTGIPVEESLGGAGLGYSELVPVLEELSGVSAGYAISVAVTGLAQIILSKFGDETQRKHWVPELASGRMIGSFSLSEATSGSDAAALRTTARRDGNHYVLNGSKLWTTQADSAGVVLVMARTGDAGPKGISTFVVEKGTPGFELGKREKKMGCSISHTMELLFRDCRIPASHRVGHEGQGFTIAMTALDSGRITIGSIACGIARAATELAVKYAGEREQFGKPISEFQGVSFLLADMAADCAAARLLVQKAAALRDEGSPFSLDAAIAKLKATDAAMKITTDAVQVLGGAGYTQDFPAERFMREAKVLQIVEGTNQVQRLVIGRSLGRGELPWR